MSLYRMLLTAAGVSLWLAGAGASYADHDSSHDEVARGGIKALETRVWDLELRAPVPGPAGPEGPAGPAGPAGEVSAADLAALQAQIDDLLQQATTKTVFVTFNSFRVTDLGGVLGADQICNDRAAASGLLGDFKAWLSDSNSSPATRFNRSGQDYVLPGGTVIAQGWADLTDGVLLAPINETETGTEPIGAANNLTQWTGSTTAGESSGFSCEDWTNGDTNVFATIGESFSADFRWSDADADICFGAKHLYCFEQ